MSNKRKASPQALVPSPDVHYSSRIHDRDSTFIATYSSTLSLRALQQLRDFSSADHRMGAWRKPSPQRTLTSSRKHIYDTGHDDDGEKYGGKRLEKLLEDMQIEGAIVVARWYGGVMLGPVRFTHIESCARDAIKRSVSGDGDASANKRLKGDAENTKFVDRKKLEQVLAARDQSISVLRALMAEKVAAASAQEDEEPKVPSVSPAKVPNYSNMPVGALERLEKAREATLAWLLQEIDKAELKIKSAKSKTNTRSCEGEIMAEKTQANEQKKDSNIASSEVDVESKVNDTLKPSTPAEAEPKTPRSSSVTLDNIEGLTQSSGPRKDLPP